MANYADSTRTPRTLTDREQRALLKVTGEHRAGYRDHMLYAMALGTGLREHELLALDMGDVFAEDGRTRAACQGFCQLEKPLERDRYLSDMIRPVQSSAFKPQWCNAPIRAPQSENSHQWKESMIGNLALKLEETFLAEVPAQKTALRAESGSEAELRFLWRSKNAAQLRKKAVVVTNRVVGNTLTKVDSRTSNEPVNFSYSANDRLVQVKKGLPGSETILGQFDRRQPPGSNSGAALECAIPPPSTGCMQGCALDVYNYEGNRIRHRHSDRGDVDYYYDDGAVLEERNATGTHESKTKEKVDYEKVIDRDLQLSQTETDIGDAAYLYARKIRYEYLAFLVEKSDPELANEFRKLADAYRSRASKESYKTCGKRWVGSGVALVTAPYELGVTTVEAATGKESGASVWKLQETYNEGSESAVGRKLSNGERVLKGVEATIGWATLGLAKYLEFKGSFEAAEGGAAAETAEIAPAAEATAARGAGKTVLGRYPAYVNKAAELNARRFNVPMEVWERMSPSERWAANQKFLDRMIARGDDVILASPVKAAEPGTYFARELEYLRSRGFTLSSDGTRMLPPKP